MRALASPSFDAGVDAATRLRIVANEAGKALRIVWTHRATQTSALFTMLATYLAIQYFIGGGAILDDLVVRTAPGLFAYVAAFLVTLRVVAGLLEERNTGTLEQTHLSPVPAGQLITGRLAAALLEGVLIASVIVGGVVVVRGIDYPLTWGALVPLGFTLAGILGLALLLAAASFSLPGIGALLHVVHMLIMVLNGTVIPPELFPRWLELVAKLMPSTLGISATRRLLIDGASLGQLVRDGSLGWLMLHTTILLASGWIAYRWQVHRALDDARMGPG